MPSHWTWILSVVILINSVQLTLGDMVFLTDGRSLDGEVVEQRSNEIIFQINSVRIVLPRSSIEKIIVSQRPKSETPVATPTSRAKAPKPETATMLDVSHLRTNDSPNTLTPSEFNHLFARIMEVKDGHTPKGTIAVYKQLVALLPSDATRWILDMGQFIEDRRIDRNEKALLEFLASAEDPLLYLTSPRIMNGVQASDVAWATRWSPPKRQLLRLDQDLLELERRKLIAHNVRPALRFLCDRAEKDYEIRKGLYLIFNYGHPPQDYGRSSINTQLLALCRLLHYGIEQGEENLLLASALYYGSILTISEERLWPKIIEYARHRIDFISETRAKVKVQHADWDPKYYPLEACLGLVCGNNTESGMAQECDLIQYVYPHFMSSEAFETLFCSANTIVEMRDWLLEKGIFLRQDELRRFVLEHPALGNNFSSRVAAAVELCIHTSWQVRIPHHDISRTNINLQWLYFKESDHFGGGCGIAGLAGACFMRSLNIPAIQGAHAYWHYTSSDKVWRPWWSDLAKFLEDSRIQEEHKAAGYASISYPKIPWDNFHLGLIRKPGPLDTVVLWYKTDDLSWIPEGIPGAYLFRHTLMP